MYNTAAVHLCLVVRVLKLSLSEGIWSRFRCSTAVQECSRSNASRSPRYFHGTLLRGGLPLSPSACPSASPYSSCFCTMPICMRETTFQSRALSSVSTCLVCWCSCTGVLSGLCCVSLFLSLSNVKCMNMLILDFCTAVICKTICWLSDKINALVQHATTALLSTHERRILL